MDIIKQYGEYMLVKSIGRYFDIRKQDFYYDRDGVKKTTYIL